MFEYTLVLAWQTEHVCSFPLECCVVCLISVQIIFSICKMGIKTHNSCPLVLWSGSNRKCLTRRKMVIFLCHSPHPCLEYMLYNPIIGWLAGLFQALDQKAELYLKKKKSKWLRTQQLLIAKSQQEIVLTKWQIIPSGQINVRQMAVSLHHKYIKTIVKIFASLKKKQK